MTHKVDIQNSASFPLGNTIHAFCPCFLLYLYAYTTGGASSFSSPLLLFLEGGAPLTGLKETNFLFTSRFGSDSLSHRNGKMG